MMGERGENGNKENRREGGMTNVICKQIRRHSTQHPPYMFSFLGIGIIRGDQMENFST